LARRQSDGEGFRDLAVVLPIVVVLLLAPPLIRIFAVPATLAGIPLIVVYIFAVWAAAILVAIAVARHAYQVPGGDAEDRSDTSGQR
jgi:hypothetical protein